MARCQNRKNGHTFLECVGTAQEGSVHRDGVLLGVGALYHVDHLLRIGSAHRLVLFDPAWKERTVLEAELELLQTFGPYEIIFDEKELTSVNVHGRTVELHKTIFDPDVVRDLQPDIIHGPHLRDRATADGKLFDDACRARAKELAPEGCMFLNWEPEQ